MSNNQLEKTVSFIVPALNEEEQITDTVLAITKASEILENYEIILVDDASTDQTKTVMNSLASKNVKIHVVSHSINSGLGAAYKTGLENAHMNFVILIPGDNQFSSESIVSVVSTVGSADIVIPYHSNADNVRPFSRRILSDGYTWLANQMAGLEIPYYNGTVVHRTDLIKGIDIKTSGFAYQLEALVKLLRRGCSYSTVGIELTERKGGESKAFHWKNILQVLIVFSQLYWYKK